MYVNMNELANLAANRTQEMQVRTVRNSAASSNPNLPEKYKLIIFQTESAITPLPKEDTPQQPETSNLDMSATCTLPRCGSFQQNKPTR
ncbi:GSCOCG00012074001-RA-CDS [Cotesia congregata]|nr:GSCOCG00012074001-RA-CDS [Cotesia congregata]